MKSKKIGLKSFLLVLILAIIATGCSKANDAKKETKDFDKEKAFSEIVEEKDLNSYILNSEITSKSEKYGDEYTSNGTLVIIKDPMTYHSTGTSVDGDKKREFEEYVTDGFRYRKNEDGQWTKENFDKEGKATFVSKNNINGDSILKPLKQYYVVSETDTDIVAELKSTPQNIDEIKNILFDDKDAPFYGELESIEAKFIFDRETNYPKSFEWELKFTDENEKTKTIRESGSYEKVNELKEIELPEEIKNL
ncbi:DUF6612 family protein [uncultured Peptoniphilus sp.]|uniref:DUF6612 family protein n=1 Tax=uncultured Peptoniphilus sp. TaxID=254354 RepID=UPI00280457AB|nr:DUF6612 family protein [uncultured Peptoniphilus sp.]